MGRAPGTNEHQGNRANDFTYNPQPESVGLDWLFSDVNHLIPEPTVGTESNVETIIMYINSNPGSFPNTDKSIMAATNKTVA